MPDFIALDSGPLGLILQKPGHPQADACRAWLKGQLSAGRTVLLPEIIDYEIRRELLRLKKSRASAKLDSFAAGPGRYLPLSTKAMRKAADLWAEARHRGEPTADPHALDVDVILAAQVLTAGLEPRPVVVATTNVGHLSRFVSAYHWFEI